LRRSISGSVNNPCWGRIAVQSEPSIPLLTLLQQYLIASRGRCYSFSGRILRRGGEARKHSGDPRRCGRSASHPWRRTTLNRSFARPWPSAAASRRPRSFAKAWGAPTKRSRMAVRRCAVPLATNWRMVSTSRWNRSSTGHPSMGLAPTGCARGTRGGGGECRCRRPACAKRSRHLSPKPAGALHAWRNGQENRIEGGAVTCSDARANRSSEPFGVTCGSGSNVNAERLSRARDRARNEASSACCEGFSAFAHAVSLLAE